MNVAKAFLIEVIVIVLISGGLGYWIYDRYSVIEELEQTYQSKQSLFATNSKKVRNIVDLEAEKSRLDIRDGANEIALPVEGTQTATDIMSIIDAVKNKVENSGTLDVPLLITKEGSITGLEPKKQTKRRPKRGQKVKEYKPIKIQLTVQSTWLGLLRFVDLLEKDDQIFKVTMIGGDGGSGDDDFKPVETELTKTEEESPFKRPYYTKVDLIIETYHLLQDSKNKK